MKLTTMSTLFVLAAVIVIVRLVRPLSVLNQLLRLRVWRPRSRLVTADEVPAYVRESLREPITEIEALGFQLIGWIAVGSDRPQGEALLFNARLFHAETRAYATVGFAALPDPVAAWLVTFSMYGADDRVVRTYSSQRPYFGEPSGTISLEPYAPTIALQWEAHRAGVTSSSVVPADLDHASVFARSAERQALFFDSLVRDRVLLPSRDAAYVMSWRLALSRYRALQRAKKLVARQRAARVASLKPLPNLPLEGDVATYARYVEQMSGPPRASFFALLFCVSVPLFIVAGAYTMGGATTAIIVLAVVLFHELGHYLAMRAFGYVDTTIFFVPFLGGVSTGRKDDATATQRMIVLLAGPLPGLVLAIVLALTSPRWLPPQALLILTGVNVFNLLPILPLDGGQIAHILVFGRHPWLDVASRAVAGVVLLLFAFVGAVFFAVLGALMLYQLPNARRQAALQRLFRNARVQFPDTPPALLFFRVLRATTLASAPFAQKLVLARQTLAYAAADVPMRWGPLLLWLSSYATMLAVGGVAVGLVFSTAWAPPVAAARQHVEPIPVMSLSCALAEAPAETIPSQSSSPMILEGVATFKTPESLAAARKAVVAAEPSVATRDLGLALLVWTRLFDEDNDDDVIDLSKARSARMKRASAAVIGASGQFYDVGSTPTGIVALECGARDEPAAQMLDDVLGDYVVCIRNEMPIVAPWSATNEPTEAQALARRTFRVAMEAARDHAHEEPMRLTIFWRLFGGGRHQAVKAYVQKRQAERARQAEAALAAERAKGPVDEEVARLVVTRIATISIDERERVTGELRQRLGTSVPQAPPNGAFTLKSSHVGSRVRVEIGHVPPKDIDSTVRPMLSWLCARACVDPRLLVEAQ